MVLPPAASSLDNRSRSESFQKVGALTIGGLRQSAIPLGYELSQFLAQSEEFLDALIELIEALADECPDAVARGTATIPHPQYARQVSQGEPDHERPLNQQHAFDSGGRVRRYPAAVRATPGSNPFRS